MRLSKKVINEYLSASDWRVKENSNNGFCYPSLRSHIANSVIADYMLHETYPKNIANAHAKGLFHIHDLGHGLTVYCAGWSLRDLLNEGFSEMPGRANSSPPKQLRTACLQMANFIGTLQAECSGAQAFNGVDTFLAPFVKILDKDPKYSRIVESERVEYDWDGSYETIKENIEILDEDLIRDEVKQCIQELIFNLNIPSRSGEIPFSNFSFDLVVPGDLKGQHPMIGGVPANFTYEECQYEADIINEVFAEIMLRGDKDNRSFAFPIPTYSITKDFDWDSKAAEKIFELTSKYGTPYFQNFINSDLNPEDVRSMCCRLTLRLDELRHRGGLFNAWDLTGSIGNVTLNLPRIGYIARDNKKLLIQLIDSSLELMKESLEIKRLLIVKLYNQGLFPYIERWMKKPFTSHFSTIGIIGMQECICSFYQGLEAIDSKEGKQLSIEILDHILEKIKGFQLETGNLYNLEESPAEGCSYRLALRDKQRWEDIIQSGEDDTYYTQGCKLPFNYSGDLFEVLTHQEELQVKYTGGSVQHIFVGEQPGLSDSKVLVKRIFETFKTPYITITPTYSICPIHGYIEGEIFNCPECDKETEVYTRVVGYYSPISRWNKGKVSEYKDRELFDSVFKKDIN